MQVIDERPQVVSIVKRIGMAGQYSYRATVRYPPERADSTMEFVGSRYGGPVVAIMGDGSQHFVDQAVVERCGGQLTADWVRRFFS